MNFINIMQKQPTAKFRMKTIAEPKLVKA